VKHIIIGSSAAGISAAKTLREQQDNDEIVIISADDAVYSRCMLHKFIGGERKEKELSFIPDGFFENNRIHLLPGVTVTGVDTVNRLVQFDSGSESYDRLLIATGAASFLPPVDGLRGTKNVYGLRDLFDAKAIRNHAAKVNNIVIIGAGLVGLDTAYGLVEMGKKPIIVEMEKSVLPMNLDTRASSLYQTKFEEKGCVFRLGSRVSGVLSDASGAVTAVTIDGGEQLPCDLLIVAVGVRPSVEFLADSGILCERGVTVDKYLATSAEGVYAAGDVTGLSETWPNAMLQGQVAALNMLGIPTEYSDTFSLKNTVYFFGVATLSVGQSIPSEGDVESYREDRNRYQKVIIRNGVPVGVILQGDISRCGFWQYIIKNKISIANINKSVWKISFADSYGVEENGEYKWVV